MSASKYAKMTPIIEINPDLKYNSEGEAMCQLGNMERTPTIINTQSTTGANPSSVFFSINPSSVKTGVPRVVWTKWYVTLTFTATAGLNGVGLINVPTTDCLRAYPITNCCNQLTISLNQNSVTIPACNVLTGLMHCNVPNDAGNRLMSMTPTMLDQNQNYSDPLNVALKQIVGTVNDPRQTMGGVATRYNTPRGAFPIISVNNDGGGKSSIVTFIVFEPLLISPFTGWVDTFPFIGLNQLTVTYSFSSFYRCWSRLDNILGSPNNLAPITGLNFALTQPPEFHYDGLTPNASIIIPNPVIHNWNSFDTFYNVVTGNNAIVQPSATFSVITSNVTLGSIPKRILIWAYRNPNYYYNLPEAMTQTDSFARLDTVQYNFDNRSGLNSLADTYDNYKQSAFNGLQMSYPQWYSGIGSVYIIDVTKNLTITNLYECPGQTLQKMCYFQCGFTNINTSTTTSNYPRDPASNQYGQINFAVVTLFIYSGLLTTENGKCNFERSILATTDVEKALAEPKRVTTMPSEDMYGGKISKALGNVGHAFNKIGQWFQRHKPIDKYNQYTAMTSGTIDPRLAALSAITGTGGNANQQQQQQQQQMNDGGNDYQPPREFQTAANYMGLGGNVPKQVKFSDELGGNVMSKNSLKRRMSETGGGMAGGSNLDLYENLSTHDINELQSYMNQMNDEGEGDF
jgi:hypothetical protein